MTPAFSVCVYCGSKPGASPDFALMARDVGHWIGQHGGQLVYGGGKNGLMGVVAAATQEAGGRVVGVIPRALLEWEVGHEGLTRLEVVDSMHTRKARMAELADGFIALPGGLGTFEELFEILTWAQLGFHSKPVGLLNVDAYYQPLVQMMERGVSEGFMKAENRGLLLVEDNAHALLRTMGAYHPPAVGKRIRDERQL